MKATITLKDEVNCKISGLTIATRSKLRDKFSYMLPYAYHVPAFKLGRWDGKVSFFTVGGTTYVNLLEDILPILIEDGYVVDIEDHRPETSFTFPEVTEDHFSHKLWPVGHEHAGKPIVLRDYQVSTINSFFKNTQSIQSISTGAGKTLTIACMCDIVGQYGRTIIIVPNKDLVIQTEEDYINLGLDVGVYFGDRKEFNKQHTICTWQSLNVLEKDFKDGKSTLSLNDFLTGVVAVIVDECHGLKGEVIRKLLTGGFAHIPIRWGLTGTIPKQESDRVSLITAVGHVTDYLRASELQSKGVLATCNINIIQMLDTVDYRDYQSELSYLTTDPDRLDYIANMVEGIADTGNTLVLVDRIKCGEGIVSRLTEDTVFINGSVKSATRKEEYKDINMAENKILVATYGTASVGINIVNIHNLVLIEPGKSFVRVIQSIGRGIRKSDKKDSVEIYDITSSAKFSKRHLRERKKFYAESEYPYSISKVDYRREL